MNLYLLLTIGFFLGSFLIISTYRYFISNYIKKSTYQIHLINSQNTHIQVKILESQLISKNEYLNQIENQKNELYKKNIDYQKEICSWETRFNSLNERFVEKIYLLEEEKKLVFNFKNEFARLQKIQIESNLQNQNFIEKIHNYENQICKKKKI